MRLPVAGSNHNQGEPGGVPDALRERFIQGWTDDRYQHIADWVDELPAEQRPSAMEALIQLDLNLRMARSLPLDPQIYQILGREAADHAADHIPPSSVSDGSTADIDPECLCEQCGEKLESSGNSHAICTTCGQSSLFSGQDESDVFTVLQETSFVSRFTLNQKIGEGAFGVVYRASDNRLRRDVALKIPKKSVTGKTLLAREARAASQLRHPNIVRVFDVVETLKQVFVVSEYIEGQTLSRYRVAHPLNVNDACQLMLRLTDAMEHAHQKGVIHRDLKPSNIVVDGDRQPNVLDFGLSRSRMDSAESLARPGAPIGTPAYMSPEQADGESERIGVTSDIYALGVIFYQLLTGHLPFSGEIDDILHAIRNDEPLPARHYQKNLDPSLNAIVMKCLAKDPADRYPSATALGTDIHHFLNDKPVTAYPHPTWRVTRRRVRNALLPIIGLIAILGIAGAAYFWKQSPPAPQDPRIQVMLAVSDPGVPIDWKRLDESTGRLSEPLEVPVDQDGRRQLLPGYYQLTLQLKNRTWRVFRTVPERGAIATGRPVVPVNHRLWEWKGETCYLPEIRIKQQPPPFELVRFGGIDIDLTGTEPISVLLPRTVLTISEAQVTKQEFSIADIKTRFPGTLATATDYDLALAFAESYGACLPSINDYLAFDQQQIALTDLKSGLKEWTTTVAPAIEIQLPNTTDQLPPKLDSQIIIQAVRPLAANQPAMLVMQINTPLTQDVAISIQNRLTVPPVETDMGFRLVW